MESYKSLQNGSDIRGIALKIDGGKDVNLTSFAAAALSKAFLLFLSEKTNKKAEDLVIAVGRDSRVTGENLALCCENAIACMGAEALSFGMASTPAMFMACVFEEINADGSIMITASHLPMERNGLKFFTKDGGLSHNEIKEIISIAENNGFGSVDGGKVILMNGFMDLYSSFLRRKICEGLDKNESDKPLLGLHVVVDAGNGAGGFFAKDVLQELGADISGSQFLEPDGTFPNHIPNPENKAAMESLSSAVLKNGADLGIIFDTDVDRAAAVGSDGKEIARNRIVALASYIASIGHPGTTIVTDSITSDELSVFLEEKLGLSHFRFKRGYKNVIDKGVELNKNGIDCQLAIETSGHAAMKENYFLDDGAFLAAKIVTEAAKLKKEGKHIEDLIADLDDPKEAAEVRYRIESEDFAAYAQKALEAIRCAAEKNPSWTIVSPNYEGIRVKTENGWFLARKSLHDPQLPINIESGVLGGVERTKKELQNILSDFDKLKI